MLVAGPYHGVMIITAYVGVDQWLLLVTFRPDPASPFLPLVLLLEQKNIMQNTEQDKASFRQSAVRGGKSNLVTSPPQKTMESPSLSKFSGQKINVFPITPGPSGLALFCLNNNSRKYQGLPSPL